MPLLERYDGLLLDLDGVVYVGTHAVPGAVSAIRRARASGRAVMFATNNASRTPEDVAEFLVSLGIDADPMEIVTSAQAAAAVLARSLPSGSPVLVVGGHGLRQAVLHRSFVPVTTADEADAVVQGFAPDLTWSLLAEGAYAVARGLPWVASNLDASIPTARGIAPGNGALVDVISAATGRRPSSVAGKPENPLFQESIERVGSTNLLVVGDRLDTDILGACRAGLDSALVLTGVTTSAQVVAAEPDRRPTFLLADLAEVADPYEEPSPETDTARCGPVRAWVESGSIRIEGSGPIATLRAISALVWSEVDAGRPEPEIPLEIEQLLPGPAAAV